MCFVLYAASSEPFPAIAWEQESPAFHVEPYSDTDKTHPAAAHFDVALSHLV